MNRITAKQLSVVLTLAMTAVSLNACAPYLPTIAASGSNDQGLAATGTPTPTPGLHVDDKASSEDGFGGKVATRSRMSGGEKLLQRILHDDGLLDYLARLEKKSHSTCTRPTAGQIHWLCSADVRECSFTLESTCVSNVNANTTPAQENDQVTRISIAGEASATQMTYKISDPEANATVSKSIQVRFEFP